MSKQIKDFLLSNINYMKYLFLLLIFTSCSVTKNLNKQTTKETTQNNIESTTTRTITETATQTITTQSDTLKTDKLLDLVLQGDSIYEDTPEQTLTVKVVKGKLHAKSVKKSQIIPISINRTIVESEHKSDKSTKQVNTSSKVKQVERKGINLNYLWWLLLLIPLWLWWKKIT